MIGSFITRALVLAFGYLYPAYECYKSVELNKPDIDQLRFWCQYWILVAGLTVCERFGDVFIGWIPMYGEAKLAFFVYLWFPKTKGTSYVYDSFVRPYVAKHEKEIDRSLLELRARAGDMALLYWQKLASYGQNKIFYMLRYIASQSTPKQPAPPQQDEAVKGLGPSAPSNCKPSSSTQHDQDIRHSSPSSASSSTDNDEDKIAETSSADSSKREATYPAAVSNELRTSPAQAQAQAQALLERRSKSLSSNNEEQAIMQIDGSVENAPPPPPSLPVEEGGDGGRLTRAMSRRTRGAANFAKTR